MLNLITSHIMGGLLYKVLHKYGYVCVCKAFGQFAVKEISCSCNKCVKNWPFGCDMCR